jgi:organic radical activating enzyme
MPAVFIRFSGCNLRCHFCDTEWNDETDKSYTVEDLMCVLDDKLRPHKQMDVHQPLVVLTGGEPARQNLGDLVRELIALGVTVQIETAGTYWWDWMKLCTIVVSPKTRHVHPKVHEHAKHWKYIIRHCEVDKIDGLPSMPTQVTGPMSTANLVYHMAKYGAPARPDFLKSSDATIWLSPCDEGDEEINKLNRNAVRDICLLYGYRAQLQIHKILGVE